MSACLSLLASKRRRGICETRLLGAGLLLVVAPRLTLLPAADAPKDRS